MPSHLSVKECLRSGWNIFKQRPWFFVGTFVFYALVQIALSWVQKGSPTLGFFFSLILSTILGIGLITLYFKAYKDPMAPQFKDLWNPEPFWKYLGTSLLVLLIVVAGLVLIIVPGIILALALSFACYLVVDRGLNPLEAIKESVRLTRGNRWKLFQFGLTVVILSLLGMIPVFLGLFVVGPVSMLAGIHAYRTLEKSAGEAPATPAPAA